ncbi:MAG: membrane protein insertase YidC [Bacteroidales bacterium]|nr:membrane protein insertase YidC [Bacteroidales bacterium]
MDRNTVIGIVLMAAVFFGFTYWQSEQAANNPPAAPAKTEAVASSPSKGTMVKTDAALSTDTTATFYTASQPNQQEAIVLANDKVEIIIDPHGGQVARVNLLDYRSYQVYKSDGKAPLVLTHEDDAEMNFLFETKNENINTANLYFVAENKTPHSVTMVATGRNGERLAFDYKLTDSYMLDMSVRTEGMSQLFSPRNATFGIAWNEKVRQFEKGYYFENMYSTLTYKLTDGSTEKLGEQGNDSEKAEGAVEWVTYKNQYFARTFISKDGLSAADFQSEQLEEGSGFLKTYKATMEAKFDPTGKEASRFQWYFGPNKFRLLQSMEQYKITQGDLDLQELVYLGWPIIRWINRFFTIYVFDFLTSMHLPMWVVLLLITLLLRVIVYPPTKKSFLSSAKMRVLKPKVDAINAKYPNKEDALKRQQEVMTLYSQYGANMMGGCLPMFIQMPIWIAMFNFVPNAIELRQQSFLWADDLSSYDDLLHWGTEIWGIGSHLSIFCLLFVASNIVFTMMTMRQQREQMAAAGPEQAAQMKLMQYMMYLMPLMFFFMFNKYSAGLNFYYFLSLVSSALTMWVLRKTTNEAKLLAKLEAYYEKNKDNPKKVSSFAARLQALQELQEQQRRAQQERRK